MDYSSHPSNNTLVQQPAGWDDRGGVLELPAIRATMGRVAGVRVFVTRWKPTAEEISRLLLGHEVQLTCIGGQPPVNLSVAGEADGLIVATH